MLSLHSRCPVCEERRGRHLKQVYVVEGRLGQCIFDVDQAKQIVSDGREAVVVPPTVLNKMLTVNKEWSREHLEHVDLSIPGIIGQCYGGLALFDGTHRAARASGEGVPFRAYRLSYEESMRCLIARDDADMTPEQIAQELRGMLRNNPETLVEADLQGDPAGEPEIRRHLTPEENQRIQLRLHQEQSA
jgi:hypothetical protein